MTGFIVGLFVLLACAVLVGEAVTRLGQAALVGQLAVGVLLGPTLLGPYLGLATPNLELQGIQFLATFFILVMAGLEVSPEEIYRTGFASALLGSTIFVGPFLVGAFLVPWLYPSVPFSTALFISLTLSITALPVMGVMLAQFRLVRTRVGSLLMNASVVNELAAVTVFAILLRLHVAGTGGAVAVAVSVVSVGLFLATVLTVHMALRTLRAHRSWDAIQRRFRDTWRSKEAGFALLMIMGLGAALYSQFLGLTFLIGAFYAGLLVTPESAGRRVHRSISQVFDAITWGFFIPLFFAFVGLGMNLRVLFATPATLLIFGALAVFAIASKFGIGAAVARFLGWPGPEARTIGFFVSSRGAVELAMAVILLQEGIFTTSIFTIVAGVGLVTTVLAPIGAARLGRIPAGPGHTPIQLFAPAPAEDDGPLPEGA